MSFLENLAQSSQGLAKTAIGFTPQGKFYNTAERVAIGVVIFLVILLIVISIVLFSKQQRVGGVWTLGAAIALGGFALWGHYFRYSPVVSGGLEKGLEKELDKKPGKEKTPEEFEDIGLEQLVPEAWED